MNSLFRKNNLKNIFGISLLFVGVISSFIVFADNNVNLHLSINPGALTVDIVDASKTILQYLLLFINLVKFLFLLIVNLDLVLLV